MKKSLKTRLTLNRETLRALDAGESSNAQGGILTQAVGCPLLTATCFNCVTQTCPTRCGQTYCFEV
jgi:hypothetical protein